MKEPLLGVVCVEPVAQSEVIWEHSSSARSVSMVKQDSHQLLFTTLGDSHLSGNCYR